jgi:hypothetical protein
MLGSMEVTEDRTEEDSLSDTVLVSRILNKQKSIKKQNEANYTKGRTYPYFYIGIFHS